MIDPESSKPKGTLAILSGTKVLVWDLSLSTGDTGNGKHQSEANFRTFDPYPEHDDSIPISSLAWNHNQMVIATSSGTSTDTFTHNNIVLLSSQTGKPLDSFQHDSQWKQKQQYTRDGNHRGSAVNSVNFGGKSRYLCIGDESGAVCLWDLKKKIRVRQFFHTPRSPGSRGESVVGAIYPCPSHQVSLDPTDTYVFSLSPSALFQYNLRDGQLVATLTTPDENDIDVSHFTKFSISDLEPNLCAIGTDDGRIYVHDVTKNLNQLQLSPLFQMNDRHRGDVTGLAFSSTHSDVLLSCGKDGMVLVHDKSKSNQKVSNALDVNDPILSMSLHANGMTCAVGCESGVVLIYDFGNIGDEAEISPIKLASIQSSEPIHSLFFAPPPRPKDKQRQSSKRTVNENENSSSRITRNTTSAPMDSTSSREQLKDDNKPESFDQQQLSTTGPPTPQSYEASPFAKRLASLSSTPKKTFSGDPKQKTAAAATNVGTSNRIGRAPLSPKKLSSSPVHKYTSMVQSRDSLHEAEKNHAEQIREMVREEVENLQDEMEEQLRNLHIDMINQFHQQSQEFDMAISKHFSAWERLAAENKQLREENERLRRSQRNHNN